MQDTAHDEESRGVRPTPKYLYPEVSERLPPGMMMRMPRFVLPLADLNDEQGEHERDLDLFRVAGLLAERGLLRMPASDIWIEYADTDGWARGFGVAQREDGDLDVIEVIRPAGATSIETDEVWRFDLNCPPMEIAPLVDMDDKVVPGRMILKETAACEAANPTAGDFFRGHPHVPWLCLLSVLVPLAAEPRLMERAAVQPRAKRDGHGRKLLPVVRIEETVIRSVITRYIGEATAARSGTSGPVSLHDVRGHVRRLGEGRVTWVRAHLRGGGNGAIRERSHYRIKLDKL